MRFIDFFAGIGGFRRGMELAGHRCVGFCEWDKYATASYTSMHLITDKQREYLSTLTLKKRQKEILKDEYRNGEWYSNDIRNVDAGSLPAADCWCFGAPCQDFSIAGKRAGLDGDRSSLIREIFRLLEEQEEQDRPEWLIYENVKGMLSSNRGLDYLSILSEMDRLGYDIEWQNINSKWFVPQNRERIYTIGHLRRYGRRKILPITGTDGENSLYQIASVPNKTRSNPNPGRTYSIEGIAPCLSTMAGGNLEPQIAIPVLTPDRAEKRQNGRRFKENGEPMFTLTAQDRHGVAIAIDDTYGFGGTRVYEDAFPTLRSERSGLKCGIGIIDPQRINNKQVSPKDVCPTLWSEMHGNVPNVCVNVNESPNYGDGIYVEMPEGFMVYAIWYEKYKCYIAIRRLTPKECFRLQGWADDYYEKAAFVNSDSRLYMQAGNGVTVDVTYAIGKKISECEKKSLEEFSKHMNKPEQEKQTKE